MLKKLVMKFGKLDCALVAQQISIYGSEYFDEKTEHTKIGRYICMDENSISLLSLKCGSMNTANIIYFDSNTECDKYLDKVVKWISEEQFATSSKLEVGKLCEVSNDGRCWARRILLAILPEGFKERYICQSNLVDIGWIGCEYARPITSIQPTIDEDDNEIYTWEMEVE